MRGCRARTEGSVDVAGDVCEGAHAHGRVEVTIVSEVLPAGGEIVTLAVLLVRVKVRV